MPSELKLSQNISLSGDLKVCFTTCDFRISGFFEFTIPAYIVRDPKLLKKLAVKDFDSFLDHRAFLDENVDPLLGKGLFSLRGQKWRGS